jgi:predicted Rossmann-fold nucleotide-binding protein
MIKARHEIESIAELDLHIGGGGALGGCVFQKLDLRGHTPALTSAPLTNTLFLGCQVEPDVAAHAHATGGLFFPDLPDLPYSIYRGLLYSVAELYEGYQHGLAGSYDGAFDCRVYRHFSESRKIKDIVEDLAQRIHDHAVTNALQDFLATGNHRVASIMGGHALSRADPMYGTVARLGRELSLAGFCVATGGGPGAMEAGHLGAYLAARDPGDLDAALAVLSKAPAMLPIDAWLDAAFEVRARFPLAPEDEARCTSVALPTWLYGHEPPNVFATHIAKYFDNSVREEGVLAIGMYGIVFAPGSAGTIQEIFQDAAQNHYRTYGTASPMVFLGEKYWTETKPVYPLLKQLAAGHEYARWLFISDDVDAIVAHLRAFAAERHPGA